MKPIYLLTLLSLCLVPSAPAAEKIHGTWSQFHGDNGSGIAGNARPPVKFGPTDGVVWSVDVPWSPSSPCVWDDRIFLTTFDKGELETRCHDARDGKLLWAHGVKPAAIEDYHNTDGSPAASTPATDGKNVVSYFGSYGVICYNTEGKELWRYELPVALSAGQYGTGTSPIIAGNRVIISRDQHQNSSLLTLDLKTGKKVWDAPRPDSSGSFGTPTLWNNNGVDEIVLGSGGHIKGYDLKTGDERWVIDGVTGFVCTTPVVADGVLYFAAWSNATVDSPLPSWEVFLKKYDKNGDGVVTFDEIDPRSLQYMRGLDANQDGKFTKEDFDIMKAGSAHCENLVVAVKPGGTGNITRSHVVWKYAKGLPYVPSPIYYDGRIYYVKDGGLITSLNAKTGEAFYTQERLPEAAGTYYSSPVAADGRIYVASLQGKLTVVKAGGEKPEILHQVDFGDRILATPALVGDKIYLRTTGKLWAFGK